MVLLKHTGKWSNKSIWMPNQNIAEYNQHGYITNYEGANSHINT